MRSSGLRSRLSLWGRIAETLEGIYVGDVEHHLDQLAFHFTEAASAGVADKALEYAMRAGEQAFGMKAYEEAARHFEQAMHALDLLAPSTDAQRCEVLLALGRADFSSGHFEPGIKAYLQAAGVARSMARPG